MPEIQDRAGSLNYLHEPELTYGNHLGLFSEEVGLDGWLLGNFPQAFAHLSLISAAVNLDRLLDEARENSEASGAGVVG